MCFNYISIMKIFVGLLIITVWALKVCSSHPVPNNTTADIDLGDYPYHCVIRIKPGNGEDFLLCEGAIIAKEWVLTSTDCVHKYKSNHEMLEVVAGIISTEDIESQSQAQVRRVAEVKISPPSTEAEKKSDGIALLKVLPFKYNKYVNQTKIEGNANVDQNARLIGYGESDNLTSVDLKVFTKQESGFRCTKNNSSNEDDVFRDKSFAGAPVSTLNNSSSTDTSSGIMSAKDGSTFTSLAYYKSWIERTANIRQPEPNSTTESTTQPTTELVELSDNDQQGSTTPSTEEDSEETTEDESSSNETSEESTEETEDTNEDNSDTTTTTESPESDTAEDESSSNETTVAPSEESTEETEDTNEDNSDTTTTTESPESDTAEPTSTTSSSSGSTQQASTSRTSTSTASPSSTTQPTSTSTTSTSRPSTTTGSTSTTSTSPSTPDDDDLSDYLYSDEETTTTSTNNPSTTTGATSASSTKSTTTSTTTPSSTTDYYDDDDSKSNAHHSDHSSNENNARFDPKNTAEGNSITSNSAQPLNQSLISNLVSKVNSVFGSIKPLKNFFAAS